MFKKFGELSRIAKISISAVILAAIVGATSANEQPQTKTAVLNVTPTSNASQKNSPKITSKTTDETQTLAFTSTTVDDATLVKGNTKITTAGVNGSETLTYQLTYTNGVQTDKKLINKVRTPPINQITSVGTYVAPAPKPSNCDSNYSGCVPIADDVDCAGGSGNGPAYAQGPINVIGYDIYGLDRNSDGIACE